MIYMKEQYFNIFAEARQILNDLKLPPDEKETLIKLISVLATSIEKHDSNNLDAESLVEGVINNQALLSMLKQQTEELDALRKLSINLTSSIDLPDVLDALVSEPAFFTYAPEEATNIAAATMARIAVTRAFEVAVIPTTVERRSRARSCVSIAPTGMAEAAPRSTPTPAAHFVPKSLGLYQSHPTRKATTAPTTTASQFTAPKSSIVRSSIGNGDGGRPRGRKSAPR
jgi:hypothetical protein